MNNETVGISAEVAIADVFNIPVLPAYRARSDAEVVLSLRNLAKRVFEDGKIPNPVKHVAENQNPADFLLKGGKTLSVKTNRGTLGKVAPQVIGQPTAETYFDFIAWKFYYNVRAELVRRGWQDSYRNRSILFKEFSVEHICDMLSEYWRYMFECDYYIHFYDVLSDKTSGAKYIALNDIPIHPAWDRAYITFTRTLDGWNESNTVKYRGISIGEFQAHSNRNCLKFRFELNGISKLLEKDWL